MVTGALYIELVQLSNIKPWSKKKAPESGQSLRGETPFTVSSSDGHGQSKTVTP